MKSSIRIASASGFWGDLPRAPVDQVTKGSIDYLVMDYLAEVTMSILQKQRMRNPDHGYALDFVHVIDQILEYITARGVRVISNAGGVHPEACKEAILTLVKERGYEDISVAVVDGDDILGKIDALVEAGHQLENIDTGEPITSVRDQLTSANVYLGSRPIVEALDQGADIVITGRVFDAGLILGPLVHEFGWDFNDYDRIASGIVAGHIIECGAQASGGNFTDWQEVKDFVNIGFPIVEAFPDGTFAVTKHEGTGGLINQMTVKEQLVYEIADPSAYLTPDGVADFTTLQLQQSGPDRVRVFNIKGKPPPRSYKVSASYKAGYKITSTLVYSWPRALGKAQKAADILQGRAEQLGLELGEWKAEYIGYNGCSENPVTQEALKREFEEIQLRISVSGMNREVLDRFGKEVIPLVLTGPGGVTGYAAGRPKAAEIVAYWPALLDKSAVEPRMRLFTI
ncbi:acyclic terpene utilization AtuA family protein [Halalkalibaculum sp. DA384]|uniref:acyclic terpene utilization AtuA family protein n=1 Tax=Halalkalibaculum sp. DA384 TaxID=3373606 RepID=UPI0037554132